ncbi:MAG: hypothetical protein IPJ25_15560 [Rhodocyclaceae bacterium]|nr:hypothetical protein [Rhodocyclaceae bacterium]
MADMAHITVGDNVTELLKMIALKCPGCGAGLQIASDMEDFACGYCGTAVRAVRQGGTVSLVADAISRVQAGTDRTAAELALIRLKNEHTENEFEIQRLVASKPASFIPAVPPSMVPLEANLLTTGVVFALVVAFISIFLVLLVVMGFGFAFFSLRSDRLKEAAEANESNRRYVEDQIRLVENDLANLMEKQTTLEKRMENNKKIVDSPYL